MDIKTGVILRRGTDGLTPAHLQHLLDNADKVQAITDEIEKRRAVFVKTEAAAMARVSEAEKAEVSVAARDDAVVKDRADLEAETAEAEKKHQAAMDALGRRTREVVAKETAAQERAEALYARWQETEDNSRTIGDHLRAREEALETQEAAAEERDRILQNRASDLDGFQKRLETVTKMVKQAVASLG